ncbi:MAG: DUF4157 domain-containing protein [bacterium]|nr:DUF4157 domain-containing protein [bacterium]
MKKSNEENRSASRAVAHSDVVQNRAVSQLVEGEEELQMKSISSQLKGDDELEAAVSQGQFTSTQMKEDDELESAQTKQLKPQENQTGMPDTLKSGIESLSGVDVSDVRVHYNSSKPAQMNAHAYAQGTNIHISPGQEQHLPHEAWHTVQQKQGRVQPTTSVNGTPVNDSTSLETEADVMGAKAMQMKVSSTRQRPTQLKLTRFTAQLSALSEAESEFNQHNEEFKWAKGMMANEAGDLAGTPDSDAAQGLKHWAKETKEGAVRHYNELHFLRTKKGDIPGLRLGKSNTTEPDLKGATGSGKPRHIEVKTTHSTDNSAINKLVVKALKQLQKRRPDGAWVADVTLYLENPACLWPRSPSTSLKTFENALKDQASIKANKAESYPGVKIVYFNVWRAGGGGMTKHKININTL